MERRVDGGFPQQPYLIQHKTHQTLILPAPQPPPLSTLRELCIKSLVQHPDNISDVDTLGFETAFQLLQVFVISLFIHRIWKYFNRRRKYWGNKNWTFRWSNDFDAAIMRKWIFGLKRWIFKVTLNYFLPLKRTCYCLSLKCVLLYACCCKDGVPAGNYDGAETF